MMAPVLDERSRRHWAAAEAQEWGWGGVTLVAQATGLSRTTIAAGLQELAAGPAATPPVRIRRPGACRPHVVDADLGLGAALDALVDPVTRGETPMKIKLLLHPEERGGTFVLAGGTHVYWVEGRNADTVVRHLDGRIEIVHAGEPHPAVTACDRVWATGTDVKRRMIQRELQEWNQVWVAR